ncbi:MAG: hypothetical protein KF791_02960 [Verrucomicrobiae bacterium]|nr:hypothetical protein [Verrucomicrobiae bacterium]
MPAPAGFVEFSATFSASGTFRAADGTPNSSSESYTVSYALVQVTLSSANGILTPDPVTLSFNDVSVVVDLVTPATGSPSEWPDFNFSMTPVTKSLSVPYAGAGSLEDFTVEWTFLSALSVTGGKGVASFVSNPSLEGSLNAVPEPAEVALVAGAGLLMLAGVRAWRRR